MYVYHGLICLTQRLRFLGIGLVESTLTIKPVILQLFNVKLMQELFLFLLSFFVSMQQNLAAAVLMK